MNMYKSYFEDEEGTSQKAIKDLIDLKRVDSDEDRAKFQSLIKGLIFANTKAGNSFLNKINDFTSGLKVEEFKG